MSTLPPPEPHEEIREVLPDLFLVQGSMSFGEARFSRNMSILRDGERLVLFNSVRLNDEGLAALDALGTVTDVVRLAAFHGRDDPFYKERYGAAVWHAKGQQYFEGVDATKGAIYFVADHELDGEEIAAVPGARFLRFSTTPPEAVLLLPHSGGTLIAGDSFQNWGDQERHFNEAGAKQFAEWGFIGPHKLGPGWVRNVKPDPAELRAMLELGFANVLPAHGDPVIGDAVEKYRPAVEAYAQS